MPREKLNSSNVKKHKRDLERDEGRKREAAKELRRDFKNYVQTTFELDDHQRQELDRTSPDFQRIAGEAAAVALEKGWEVDLVHRPNSPNMSVEVYCKLPAECGIRFQC